jgi:hypothetical protein
MAANKKRTKNMGKTEEKEEGRKGGGMTQTARKQNMEVTKKRKGTKQQENKK